MSLSEVAGDHRQAVRQLARALFPRLRRENPHWDYADLRRHLDLPDTKSLQELAQEAGFVLPGPLSRDEENAVLRTLRRGVFGPEDVARETKLALEHVKTFLDEIGVPFGAGGWGMFPWPGGRARVGSQAASQPRRVSGKGQISHKGRLYGLGMDHAGAVAWVEESGQRLTVCFRGGRHADRPPVTLYRIG